MLETWLGPQRKMAGWMASGKTMEKFGWAVDDQFADPFRDSYLERVGQVLKPVGVETSDLCKGGLFGVTSFGFGRAVRAGWLETIQTFQKKHSAK